MAGRHAERHHLGRRGFLAALLAATGLSPWAMAAGEPWAERPAGKVDKLNFVVWTYGDIYAKISKKFADDWGVSIDSTISSFNDHPTKLMTMYAGNETIDVSQSSPFSFPNFISQGLVEPLDGLPGAAEYLKDFTESAKQVAVYDGKLMGLPYFSTVWVWNYYTELLEKAGVEPFKTYEELLDQLRKAKKDKIAEYPILWIAGVGLEQLPGTWYQLTWNRGGSFFDKQGNHQLGPGSIARDAEMVDSHLYRGAGRSRIAEGSIHHRRQGLYGGEEPLPRAKPSLRAQHHQRSGAIADCREGEGLGLARRRQNHWRHSRLFPVHGQPRQGLGVEAAAISRRQDEGRQIHSGRQPRARCDARLGLRFGDEERRRHGRLEVVGRPAEDTRDLGQGDLCRGGLQLGLQALAFSLDRPGQHRGSEGVDGSDHRRPVLR